MPTSFGFAFGTMALVLFFLAVGYANNLIYIFVFFLISVALTGVLVTNKNVDGVEAENLQAESFFAEEKGTLVVTLKNHFSSSAWEINTYFEKSEEKSFLSALNPAEEKNISVFWTSQQRGRIRLPRLIIQSTFPFGLLRAWKVYRKPREILVYPARKGERSFPLSSLSSEDFSNTGLFRDHRTYQSTDSMMRVDWRASARRQELLVKNFEHQDKPTLHFLWSQTEYLNNIEDRLSQLCLWIDEAERKGHQYSLQIGTHQTSLERGPAHWKRCLEVLATISPGELS